MHPTGKAKKKKKKKKESVTHTKYLKSSGVKLTVIVVLLDLTNVGVGGFGISMEINNKTKSIAHILPHKMVL